MQNDRIEDLLSDRAIQRSSTLPVGFAVSVVERTREVRLALLRHRRWLIASFLFAIALAGLVSLGVYRESTETPPAFSPALDSPFESPPLPSE